MPRSPRHTPESVAASLVEAGAPRPYADEIVDSLVRCGLSAAQVRSWLDHPQLEYPVKLPPREWFGRQLVLEAGPTDCIRRGHLALVLSAVREFVDASPDERLISLLLQLNIVDVRSLTDGEPEREQVVAEILTIMRDHLRKPQRVSDAALSSPELFDGQRLVDRILRHEEQAVLQELRRGEIDLQAILATGTLNARWNSDDDR